jgi:hypothetical protein
VAASFGRITTGQTNQRLLNIALDFDFVGPLWLRFGIQGRSESFGHQSLTNPPNSAETYLQSGHNLLIRIFRPRSGIRQQENACMGELAGCALTDRNQMFQIGPFLSG